jgi:hypothetical protein
VSRWKKSNERMGINSWDDVDRHKRARADASPCVRCGGQIGAGEPVWLLPCRLMYPRPDLGINFVQDCVAAGCARCASQADGHRWRSGACPGCGRLVHIRGWGSTYFCSDRCRNKVYGARFRKTHPRPKNPRPVVQCATCGRNFLPRRADARTCSPACRQKAYRQRARVTNPGQDTIVLPCPSSVTGPPKQPRPPAKEG